MEQSKYNYCLNCNHQLQPTDNYCPNCSQKVYRTIPTTGSILKDAFISIFNIDSKILQTLKNLLIPAQLTIAFFAGKRQRYYSPFKVLFVIVLATLTLANVSGLKNKYFNVNTNKKTPLVENSVLDSIRNNTTIAINTDTIEFEDELDSLNFRLSNLPIDSFTLQLFNNKTIKLPPKALTTSSAEEIIEKHNIEYFWNQLLVKQFFKIEKDPQGFLWYIIGNIFWMLILTIPSVAAVLYLLYIRHQRYYIEHFVFLLHTTSFVFICIFIYLTLVAFHQEHIVSYGITFIGIPLYIAVAQKRYYVQSWLKTLVKFTFMVTSYIIFMLLFFAIISSISFSLF